MAIFHSYVRLPKGISLWHLEVTKNTQKKNHKKGQWEVRGVLTFDIHFRTFANFHMGTWHLGGPFAPPLAQLYTCN